jgi:hypothetical protein
MKLDKIYCIIILFLSCNLSCFANEHFGKDVFVGEFRYLEGEYSIALTIDIKNKNDLSDLYNKNRGSFFPQYIEVSTYSLITTDLISEKTLGELMDENYTTIIGEKSFLCKFKRFQVHGDVNDPEVSLEMNLIPVNEQFPKFSDYDENASIFYYPSIIFKGNFANKTNYLFYGSSKSLNGKGIESAKDQITEKAKEIILKQHLAESMLKKGFFRYFSNETNKDYMYISVIFEPDESDGISGLYKYFPKVGSLESVVPINSSKYVPEFGYGISGPHEEYFFITEIDIDGDNERELFIPIRYPEGWAREFFKKDPKKKFYNVIFSESSNL